ncbi:MAG: serine hydrolase [Butyribacter sp.]|nr:serine hydrolase [bacterium]MDY3854125.1 serine hydrolase [Butyribacter sp.]
MKRRITAMLIAMLSITSVLCSTVVSQAEVIHETDLEDYLLEELSSAHALGMGISIVSADKELYCAAYGMAQKTEADYVLGDLTKSFTAAGIMRLEEDGELSLEDTIGDFLSEYKGFKDITIRELLTQTSGIASGQTMDDANPEGTKGTFEDANLNYTILGDIIATVSGMEYEEYISDNILDPLEMTSTYSMRHDADMGEGMINGYKNYFGFPFSYKYQYSADEKWMTVPSSYMISDVKDMGRYLQMYLQDGGDVLSEESIESMLSGDTVVPKSEKISKEIFGKTAKYGMGWIEKETDGQKVLYASGKTEGHTTMMMLLPEQNVGIVMMFNSADALVGQKLIQQLAEGVIAIELGNTPETIGDNTYFLQHIAYDVLMLLVLIAACLPIFLMSVWCRKRRQKLADVPGIIADVVIHIILPTVALVVFSRLMPAYYAVKFMPDVFYVSCLTIGVLYLGALVKLVAGIVIAVKGPEKNDGKDEEEKAEPEQSEEKSDDGSESDETEKAEPENDSKVDEKVDKTEAESKEPEEDKKDENDKTGDETVETEKTEDDKKEENKTEDDKTDEEDKKEV